MNDLPDPRTDRLLELLADRALFGLDADEQRELQGLLQESTEIDPDCIDHVAAALVVTSPASDFEPLPERLAVRIRSQVTPPPEPEQPRRGSSDSWLRFRETVAWLTAAAAVLVAVFAWSTRPTPQPLNPAPIASIDPPVIGQPGASLANPTVAQQREQLLASAPDVIHLHFSTSQGPPDQQAGGDIVWSSERQAGFLRLRGLECNDPAQSQYQLWIIAGDPIHKQIINGGVFNVDRQPGELILSFDPHHFVNQPKMFVISIEPPGGSLDLTGSGIPLMAKVGDYFP